MKTILLEAIPCCPVAATINDDSILSASQARCRGACNQINTTLHHGGTFYCHMFILTHVLTPRPLRLTAICSVQNNDRQIKPQCPDTVAVAALALKHHTFLWPTCNESIGLALLLQLHFTAFWMSKMQLRERYMGRWVMASGNLCISNG